MPKTGDADDQKAQEEASKVHAEAEANKQDETVPGGRYEVDGRIVDANGVEISDKKK